MSDVNADKQAESLAWATREHLPWTAEDDRIVSDNSWSLLEMARQTKRTYYAVDSRRKKRLGVQMHARQASSESRAAATDSPFDIKPNETVCPDCFTIRASSGSCNC